MPDPIPARPAQRLEHWFWRGLTAIAFAATLLLCVTPPARAAATPWGIWRVELDHPGGPLPFGLELRQGRNGAEAFLLNPPERLRAERVKVESGVITLDFPSYRSSLQLTVQPHGTLAGEAHIIRRVGPLTLKARGSRAAWRFFAQPAPAAGNLTGRWLLVQGKERGLAQLRQTGNRVTGSVQFPSGDTRYLAGEISGNELALSHFDGSASGIWRARFDGNSLSGGQFAATSTAPSPWSATRLAADPAPPAVAVEKPASDRLAFRFPDSSGRQVSLSDPAYRGKVVVITLGGAWCPNCHDEARFLADYARRHPEVAFIGLHFEYGDDAKRAFTQIDSYKARYRIPYPLLLAGQPTPESTSAALGALGPVKVYPSTIFIGRDGRVKEVHVGWAGPATGALNAAAKREFEETIERLKRA